MTATNTKKAKATGRRNAVAFKVFSNNSKAKFTSVIVAQQPVPTVRGCA